MKIQVTTITQYQDLDANETRQNVPWQILDGETVVSEGNQSFPLTATPEEIKDFLTRTLTVHVEDTARAAETAEADAQKAAADAVAAELNGFEITL